MLKVENISFSYGSKKVLRDISFTIGDGEIVGLLGKNGTGKTTLMKILATCLVADCGEIELDGLDPFSAPLKYRRRIGYLPEKSPLYEEMTVKEYLKYRAKLKGERTLRLARRVVEVMKLCSLQEKAQTPISALSLGYRKRVSVAETVLRRPGVLLFDDLFPGLDSEQRRNMREILSNPAIRSSVLISGHELPELCEFCSRFLILRDGRIAEEFSMRGKTPAEGAAALEKLL